MSSANWSDLRVRLGSGLVLAAVGLALVLSTGLWLRIGISALSGVMIWELARLTAWRFPQLSGGRHAVALGLIGALAQFLALIWASDWAPVLLILAALAGMVGAHRNARWVFGGFALAILLAGHGLVMIREGAGLLAALWVVATVVISDVAGYFVGRAMGGPKFWPRISPKKTWSGTIAGWLGAMALALILWATGRAGVGLIALAPLVALAGQMGDIAESWLKRRVGVKDSSALIPGHGGALDRLDAICGALLAVSLALALGALPMGRLIGG